MSIRNLYHASRPSCPVTAIALLLAGIVGCGSATTYPVTGKIVFKDGTPFSGGLVRFRPVDEKLQVSARGDIQSNGTFILGTYKEDDGAVPGKYQVAITPPPRPKVREKPVGRPVMDPRFENFETSGLEFEVARHKNNFTI